MDDVRALTIRQPWASLVAVGAKTIETRGQRTNYRGPLLIHAGKVAPERGMNIGGWHVYAPEEGDARWRLTRTNPDYRVEGGFRPDRSLIIHELPLGAVVASCRLVDCVPMVDVADAAFGQGSGAVDRCVVVDDDLLDLCTLADEAVRHGEQQPYIIRSIQDQRPFGGYRPGRWAYLLEDVRPCSERCPRCWGKGHVFGTDPNYPLDKNVALRCPTCEWKRTCAPVPMRGRQGLWIPKPEDWGRAA